MVLAGAGVRYGNISIKYMKYYNYCSQLVAPFTPGRMYSKTPIQRPIHWEIRLLSRRSLPEMIADIK